MSESSSLGTVVWCLRRYAIRLVLAVPCASGSGLRQACPDREAVSEPRERAAAGGAREDGEQDERHQRGEEERNRQAEPRDLLAEVIAHRERADRSAERSGESSRHDSLDQRPPLGASRAGDRPAEPEIH